MFMLKDPLHGVSTGIYTHRNFENAALTYIESLVKWRCDLGAFNKVISSYSRHLIVRYVLFLHFGNDSGNPDKGATIQRLLDLCLERDRCGSRVLRNVLSLAQMTGYLSIERGRFDQRLKVLEPTDKLLEQMRRYYAHTFRCFDVLLGDRAPRQISRDDPDMVERVCFAVGGPYIDQHLLIGEYFEDLHSLFGLDGGFATVFAVVDAQMRGQTPPSYKDIAQRFRLSASQARKILKSAEARGLMTFDDMGKVAGASGLVEACKRFIARELALYAKFALGLEPYLVPGRTPRGGHESGLRAYG